MSTSSNCLSACQLKPVDHLWLFVTTKSFCSSAQPASREVQQKHNKVLGGTKGSSRPRKQQHNQQEAQIGVATQQATVRPLVWWEMGTLSIRPLAPVGVELLSVRRVAKLRASCSYHRLLLHYIGPFCNQKHFAFLWIIILLMCVWDDPSIQMKTFPKCTIHNKGWRLAKGIIWNHFTSESHVNV